MYALACNSGNVEDQKAFSFSFKLHATGFQDGTDRPTASDIAYYLLVHTISSGCRVICRASTLSRYVFCSGFAGTGRAEGLIEV